MKIALDGRVLKHRVCSGVENYAFHLAEALKKKTECMVLIPSSGNRYVQQLWEQTVLPFSARGSDLLFCPANIAPVWLPLKTKLVLTLHDTAFRTFPGSVSRLFALYYRYIVPKAIRRAAYIVTVSEASRREIMRYYPEAEAKMSVIPLGIHHKYRVVPEIRKRRQILFVGSVNARKNVTGVIEAFEKLPLDCGASLVIVGRFFGNFPLPGPMAAALQRAEANENIIFKTGLDDAALVREYNAAACFVFPSFYEGFGLPPLEAMACGTPVIASDLAPMTEVCGQAALYVDPHDTDALVGMMLHLLNDDALRAEMTSKGLEHVKRFSWEKAAKSHMDVFTKVLQE